MKESQKPESKKKQLLNTANNYVKYSGVAFQMIGIIGVFTFIGYKIDESRQSETPLITGLFSLVGVMLALYSVLKSLK